MTDFHSFSLGGLLSPMEETAFHLLLAGDHPIFEQLRRQINFVASLKRVETAVGFYLDIELSTDSPALLDDPSFAIGDVGGEAEGSTYGVRFVIFIKAGRLVLFEGANGDDVGWPKSARSYNLYYEGPQGQRDWKKLQSKLPAIDVGP